MKSKKFMNKGFSLIELLVTATIIGSLSLIGIKSYKERKEIIYISWAKAEMTDISQVMRTAKSYDGYFHQFIYTMGYQPKGKVYASVGTDASATTICCNKYPAPGASPCRKNNRGGFTYYNCENVDPHTATDNIEICDSKAYSNSCDKESVLKALKTSDFSTCTPNPTAWCDCSHFTIGAKTYSDKILSINQLGTLCLE